MTGPSRPMRFDDRTSASYRIVLDQEETASAPRLNPPVPLVARRSPVAPILRVRPMSAWDARWRQVGGDNHPDAWEDKHEHQDDDFSTPFRCWRQARFHRGFRRDPAQAPTNHQVLDQASPSSVPAALVSGPGTVTSRTRSGEAPHRSGLIGQADLREHSSVRWRCRDPLHDRQCREPS